MQSAETILAIYYFGTFCVTPVIWIGLFLLLRKRVHVVVLILTFIITPIAINSILRLTDEPAMELAARLAVPSIQEAVHTQCKVGSILARAEGYNYSLDFGHRFNGEAARCSFEYDTYSWVCECR